MKFTDGINRLFNAPETSVRDLFNTRLLPYGRQEAAREGGAYSGYIYKGANEDLKPIVLWNDEWYTTQQGNDFFIYNDSLYVANSTHGTPKRYDDEGTLDQSVPVVVDHVQGTLSFPDISSDLEGDGIDDNSVANGRKDIRYLLVPINKRGEAGPFHWHTFFVNVEGTGDKVRLEAEFEVTDAVDTVEVWRTRQGSNRVDDNTFFFIQTLSPFEESGEQRVRIIDQNNIPQTSDPDAEAGLTTFDRDLNVYDHIQGSAVANTIGAETAIVRNGVAIYGGVRFPTKIPAVSGNYGGGYVDVKCILEYTTPKGPVYGQEINATSAREFYVEYTGETAVLLFVEYQNHTDGSDPNNGDYFLFDRVTPNEFGRYISSKAFNAQVDPGYGPAPEKYTFVDYAIDTINGNSDIYLDLDTSEPLTSYTQLVSYTEGDLALFSEQNRPHEVTYKGQTFPGDIITFAPARIDEVEQQRSYDFYCFTTRGVFYCEFDNVASTIIYGTVTDETTIDDPRKVVSTRDGIAFLGTDGHAYFVRGRQIANPLDYVLDNYLTGMVDITYNQREDEVWITADQGVYVYSFRFEQWIANYGEAPDWIHYDKLNDVMMRRSNSATDTLVVEGGTFVDTTSLDTQAFARDSERARVRRLRVRSEPIPYKTVMVEHAILNGEVNDLGDSDLIKVKVEFPIENRRPRYPKLVGNEHAFRIKDFQILYDFDVQFVDEMGR